MEKGLFSTGWKIMEMAQLPDIMGLEIVKLNIYGKYLQVLNWAITYYPFTLTKDKRSVVLHLMFIYYFDFNNKNFIKTLSFMILIIGGN